MHASKNYPCPPDLWQLSQDSYVTTFSYTFNKAGKVASLITTVKTNDPPDVKPYTERPDTCLFTYY